MKLNMMIFLISIKLLLVGCNAMPKNSVLAIENKNVRKIDLEDAINLIINKKGKIFFASSQCGGSILTFRNVVLPEIEDYHNEIFFFGSDSELEEYLHDSVTVYWFHEVNNFALAHKMRMKKLLKKIDPSYKYDLGLPFTFEYVDNKVVKK
jgi:hypothetical protein